MTLNYFCTSVILGRSALQGHGLAACFLGLHTAARGLFPKQTRGFSDALRFPRCRSRGWGARPCCFMAIFQKGHLEMSVQLCYCCVLTGKKEKKKKPRQQCGTATKCSDKFTLYHLRTIFQKNDTAFTCQETTRNCLEKTAGLHCETQIYNP